MGPVGFEVTGTGVRLDDDIVVFNEHSGEQMTLGHGMISWRSPDGTERGRELYQRLSRRFRKRPGQAL
jgi:hypothetical protein